MYLELARFEFDHNSAIFWSFLFPRDALQGHRRGKNPVAYVFIFILPRSRKRQCLILIEV